MNLCLSPFILLKPGLDPVFLLCSVQFSSWPCEVQIQSFLCHPQTLSPAHDKLSNLDIKDSLRFDCQTIFLPYYLLLTFKHETCALTNLLITLIAPLLPSQLPLFCSCCLPPWRSPFPLEKSWTPTHLKRMSPELPLLNLFFASWHFVGFFFVPS